MQVLTNNDEKTEQEQKNEKLMRESEKDEQVLIKDEKKAVMWVQRNHLASRSSGFNYGESTENYTIERRNALQSWTDDILLWRSESTDDRSTNAKEYNQWQISTSKSLSTRIGHCYFQNDK